MALITNPQGLVKDNQELYAKVKAVSDKNIDLFAYNNFYNVDYKANVLTDAIELQHFPQWSKVSEFKRLKVINLTDENLDALISANTKEEFLAVFGYESHS